MVKLNDIIGIEDIQYTKGGKIKSVIIETQHSYIRCTKDCHMKHEFTWLELIDYIS
jgi:hypothetical protein